MRQDRQTPAGGRARRARPTSMRLGGLLCHAFLVPLWLLAIVPVIIASVLLVRSGHYAAELAQVAIAIVCGQLTSKSGDALGVAGTVVAGAITAALANGGAETAAVVGSGIWFVMTWLNWGHRFAYSPAWTRLVFWLDMPSYYREAGLRGAGVAQMRTSRTIYMFHPHGITTCGFSSNGVWSREFNERTTPKPLPAGWEGSTWPGTTFFIAATLREPSHGFKVLCDISGRLESASKGSMLPFFKQGRNVAIIPGGFEEATLFEHGVHRVAISKRKGLIKYALQHGYALTPIYTFGENRTFHTARGLLRLRLALNRFQMPAVAFWGEPLCPILPRKDAPCLSYVGAPLELPTLPDPTPAEVDAWHAKYLAALTALFDASKAEAGEPEAALEIW